MTIHLIRHDPAAGDIPTPVLGQLLERARDTGRQLVLHYCESDAALRRAMEQAKADAAEAVLLDPGPFCDVCVRDEAARLSVPVVEVHDDGATPWEPSLDRTAIHGYGAQGYVLALAVALERIGCDACSNDFHVGT